MYKMIGIKPKDKQSTTQMVAGKTAEKSHIIVFIKIPPQRRNDENQD